VRQFSAVSIPTLLLFGGEEWGRVIEAQGKEYIVRALLGPSPLRNRSQTRAPAWRGGAP